MNIESRRKFLKGAGLFGVLAGGVLAGKTVVEKHTETKLFPTPIAKTDPTIVEQIENRAVSGTLSLMNTYGELVPAPSTPFSDSMFLSSSSLTVNSTKFVPGTEKQVQVNITPGPDGELYIHTNGEWKRIVTA